MQREKRAILEHDAEMAQTEGEIDLVPFGAGEGTGFTVSWQGEFKGGPRGSYGSSELQ